MSIPRNTVFGTMCCCLLLCLLFPKSNASAIELSKEEKDYLSTKGEIVFVSQTRYPPFEFTQENGQHEGMMLDVVRWMAVELGFQPVFMDTTFQQAQDAILSGKADILTSLFYSEKRSERFEFSQTLFDVPASIFVKAERTDIKNLHDLNGKTIAIQRGDYAKDFLESQGIHFDVLYTDNFDQATDMVVEGKADAVIGDEQIVLYHIFSNRLTDHVKKVGEPLYIGKNCMASNKSNSVLIGILNKGILEAGRSGMLDKISRKWLGSRFSLQKSFVERHLWPLTACVGGLLLVSLGVWVWNVRLRTLVRNRTKVLECREEALRESEENFRAFFETVDDMIFVASLDGKILHTNPSVSWKLGYSPSELSGMHLLDVRPAEKRGEAEGLLSLLLEGRAIACPLPLQNKAGSLIPVDSRAWLSRWNGTECIFCISKDLSREQEALQKFNGLFNNSPVLMAVTTLPEGRFTDVNETFLNTLGYSRDEALGKTAAELGLFLQPEKFGNVPEQLHSRGRLVNCELQVACKDGRILDGIISGEVIEHQGREYLLTVLVDQSVRKQAEQKLRDSEEMFRSIFDNSLSGILFSEPDGFVLAANPAACEMLGWSEQEIREGGRDLVVDRADPRLAQALEERKRTGRFWGELNLRRKDGSIFPVELSSTQFVLSDDSERACIIFKDISERKRAENALREAHRRLDELIEFFPDATFAIDAEGRVTHWNKAIEQMSGVSKCDMLEKGDHEYALPFYGIRRPLLIDLALAAESGLEMEGYDLLERDGDRFLAEAVTPHAFGGRGAYLSATASTLRDSQGNPIGAIESIRDFTERKMAERALMNALEEKVFLLREIHHRVKNNMQVISSLLTLQAERVDNEQLRESLLESQQRILAMAMIHEALYSGKNLATVDLSVYVKNLVEHLQEAYSSDAQVRIALELEKIELGIDQAVPCGLIINELVTNSFKHAFPEATEGMVQIKIHLVDGKEVVLEVSDNGVGLTDAPDLDSPDSLGLRLVQGLLRHQLKGTLKVANDEGTAFVLRWSLPDGEGVRT